MGFTSKRCAGSQHFKPILLRRAGFGAAALLACAAAQADGFRLPYQGAAASGQGEAFVAQADNASALYYNPAGLARLRKVNYSVGASLVGGETEYTSPAGKKYYADYGEDFAFPVPANFYLTANLSDLGFDALGPLTVGIGLTSSYGLVTHWRGVTPFSDLVSRARLPMLDIKPTLAYAVNDWLALGFGLDIYTFAGFIGAGGLEIRTLQNGVGTELNGDGTVVGYNGSLLLTPWRNADGQPLLNFGLIYRTNEQLGLSGNYLVNGVSVAKAKSGLALPQILSGGLAYWPVRDRAHEWKLEYDMEFDDWSSAQTSVVALSNGTKISTPLHWNSVYGFSVGTEYKWLNPGWLPDWDVALRGGFQRSNTPIPHDTYNPQINDSDWSILSFGVGFDCKGKGRLFGLVECGDPAGKPLTANSLGLDVSFQAFFFDSRQIAGNINPRVDGHYSSSAYVGSVNFNMTY